MTDLQPLPESKESTGAGHEATLWDHLLQVEAGWRGGDPFENIRARNWEEWVRQVPLWTRGSLAGPWEGAAGACCRPGCQHPPGTDSWSPPGPLGDNSAWLP